MTRNRIGILGLTAALSLSAAPAIAQDGGQSGMQHRHGQADGANAGAGQGMQSGPMLSGISEGEKEALLKGSGLGAGMIAMMNGYPGPKHVLEMGDELELTAEQREKIGTLFAERKASFVEMGRDLVEMDEKLTAMFASGSVDTKDVEKLSMEIGELQGKLRAGHLNAHVLTWEALTPAQRDKLASMQGMHGGQGMHQGEGGRMRHRQGATESTTSGT